MRVSFISRHTDTNRGSYRIFVKDINFYLNCINIKSEINPTNLKDFNILLYDKGIKKIEKKCKGQRIGIINPNSLDEKLLSKADFIIVGSVEERESLIKYNKNCFIYPLIESMYQNIKPKIHIKKKKLIIGYHGNSHHLNHLSLGLKEALEKLSKEIDLEFLVISSNDRDWIEGKPNIKIKFKKWNLKTIQKNIQSFDIGVVPNISEFYNSKQLEKNLTLGKYSTDLKIRFKNKSNIGRLLVLCQCGIPAVADLTPSNMHILGNPDNGYAVLSEDSWYYALKELSCEKRRNFISKNAYHECKRLYNPIDWVSRLADQIKNI